MENSERTKNVPAPDAIDIDRDAGNFSFEENYALDAGVGLSADVVDYIADAKGEPDWIRKFRRDALKVFEEKPMPTHWAPALIKEIDFSKIRYYLAKGTRASRSWDDVPDDVKKTFERLGVPEQERRFLAGVDAQFDSESAYSRMKDELAKQGVIFVGPLEGLTRHESIFRPWFGKVIPTTDSKFSALNSACFSGGSFIYVPKGVKVKQPLQAYFRINAENSGQFERTLIIADEGAELVYMEGCTAPQFDSATLHSGVVELVALKGAKIQYVTVQNWAGNVFNLVTQRGMAMEDAEIRWIDCNIGSRLTMKYPAVVLKGARSRGEVLSIALAHSGQIQDTGAKMIHLADGTTSNIISKSVSVPHAAHQRELRFGNVSGDRRARERLADAARGERLQSLRRPDFLHAPARADGGRGDEPRRERLRERPRQGVPDGIFRRTQAPHRNGNGRLRRLRRRGNAGFFSPKKKKMR